MTTGLLAILLLSGGLGLSAQTDRNTVSEEEIKIQELFLEATREKLLGNWEKAAEGFEEVLRKSPGNPAAAYELARICKAQGQADKALQYARQAVASDPGNKWYKFYLAERYQEDNQDLAAAQLYRELSKTDPDQTEYPLQEAYFLVRAGQAREAIAVYDALEKRTGPTEELSRHKHTLYAGMGDYRKAARELERLATAYPDKPAYLHLLATFYAQIGDPDRAMSTYRDILEKFPEDARARTAVSKQEKGGNIITWLQSLQPLFDNPDVDIDTKIKEILPTVNRLAETPDASLGNSLLGLTLTLTRVHPGQAKAHAVLGDILYHTGEPDKALQAYRKTLDLDPSVWSVWEQVLHLLLESCRWTELAGTGEAALEVFPNQGLAELACGIGWNYTGRQADARSALEQALVLTRKQPDLQVRALAALAYNRCAAGQPAAANTYLDRAQALAPEHPDLLRSRCHCLATAGTDPDATEAARNAVENLLAETAGLALTEATIGYVYLQASDLPAARSWTEKALSHGGDRQAQILEQFGDILLRADSPAAALPYWKKAKAAGAQSPTLDRKIRDHQTAD
jgi:tetratricopeptide (TPR) repeat protein